MKLRSRVFTALVLIAVSVTPSYAVLVGTKGNLYSIAEKDAAVELEERMAAVDWKKVMDPQKLRAEAEAFRPEGIQKLPAARVTKTRIVDMTYTLEHDIPDGKGGILYPEGFTFNPLDYMQYPFTLIALDATSKAQMAWFLKSPYAKDLNVKVMLTDGSVMQFSEKFDIEVGYADGMILKRFQLKAVPSIIKQNKNMMEIKEVAVHGS